MALDEIRLLFDRNREFLREVVSIQITGGEPFMRKDLAEIVLTIHQQLPDCRFWIPTNALDTMRIKETTIKILRGLDGGGLGISVSIDGLRETHNRIRGVRGAFEAAIETLKMLSALRAANPTLNLSVGMTLTPQNIRQLGAVHSIARSHGADFSFRPVNISESYYRNLGATPTHTNSAKHLLPQLQVYGKELIRRRGFISSLTALRYAQGTLDYISGGGVRSLPCTAATTSLSIDPYGKIYPCLFIDEPMGNARKTKLEEIWGSMEAEKARKKITIGDCPNCWVECEVYREIRKDPIGLLKTALRAALDPRTAGIA
jgi:MoaA/NifB/PqqE/SkfB family radical SAM enzyme